MTAVHLQKKESGISTLSKRNLIAFICVSFFLILPMFVIKNITFDAESQVRDGAAAATAAIGAIFRSNSRTLLRSTIMSALRTSLRAVTRRVVRSFLPIVVRLFLPALQSAAHRSEPENTETAWVMPLLLGCVTLGLSFTGVVIWSGGADSQTLLYGFSVAVSGIMAASALLTHVVFLFWVSRHSTLTMKIQTPVDGILLQAYFTGALSYLPLSTDITLDGDKVAAGKCAAAALLGLIGLSLVLDSLGLLIQYDILRCWAAHLLLYSFVVSFPLKPLSGADIFACHKGLWGGVFGLSMLCFLLNIPDAFYEIL